MRLLTIDTSTSSCSVALTDGERLLGEFLLAGGQALSSRLFDQVDSLLKATGMEMNDLDGFGIALGPGSFTGLRIGAAAIKGMALATGKPVAGFSSLAMLAMNLPHADRPVSPLFDARKNEVYAGHYRMGVFPEQLAGDIVISPAVLVERITEPTLFIGEGAVRYRELITSRIGPLALFGPSSTDLPRASCGALLALAALGRGEEISPEALAPVYLRLSEAELAKQRRENA